jgi:hypothetical protein
MTNYSVASSASYTEVSLTDALFARTWTTFSFSMIPPAALNWSAYRR